ncbi:MAG: tripartite tricarboxylate transporter substrate binding protein [Betaproteobacteria bacterium]|nr:tripartite tricarboxylate transporter substrate binding protein [Betaproteobacteria bacterium]
MGKITSNILGATFIACLSVAGHAQQKPQLPNNYPNKPIRVLVGAAPGGGTDLVARLLTQKLAERWNASIIVDNRAGGAGIVAVNIAAQAAPDGYTVIISGNQFITIGAQGAVPYDIRTTFDAVVQLTSQPYLVVVNATVPVNSVQELIAYAKSKPGMLNYGSGGTGTLQHLGVEILNSIVGVKMVHVPYKGVSPALIDAVSGQIQMLFSNGIAAAPYTKSGRLRAIAVTSRNRMQLFPTLPTVAESGVPGYELVNMYGLYAPVGVAPAILAAFNRDFSQIVNSQEFRDKLAADGAEAAAPNSPAEFRALYLREINKWEKFIKTSGIKLN